MKKLSVAMLAVFVLAELTNAAPGGKKGNSKEIASIIGPALGTYIHMQDAYFVDTEKIGSFKEIGFVWSDDLPYFELGESESSNGIFVKAKDKIGRCPAGGQWSFIPYTENGGRILKYKCVIDAGCESLYPNLKYLCEHENNLDAPVTGYMKDFRDNQVYSTVQVDGLEWMSENLNYRIMGSRCLLDKNANCDKYGRLYSWNTAKEACPSGWRLPRQQEWVDLLVNAGWNDEMVGPRNELLGVGKKLKSKYVWKQNDNGTNDLGFSVLPSGIFYVQQNKFIEDNTAFWSSDIISHGKIWSFLFDGSDDVYPIAAGDDVFQSVRCVKDE